MENGFLPIDNQCVSCIVATLKTYHRRGIFGQKVDNFAFSFIAPLRA